MIRFIVKGLLRDRHRSRLPILVVALGVMLTTLMQAWITGVMGESIEFNAKYATGHVKIMSRAYAENSSQKPNDLALMEVGALLENLHTRYPDHSWVKRIQLGGLVDVPDENGETRVQGPAGGLAIDLLSENNPEIKNLRLQEALVQGKLPQAEGEILISEEFANTLDVSPGDQISLLSTTMFGSMTIYNMTIAGTVNFGTRQLDRGALIMDIQDARRALDMQDACGEILGYLPDGKYHNEEAKTLSREFNERFSDPADEFSPIMVPLSEQNNMGMLVEYADVMAGMIAFVFVLAMSIVLWNTGLIGGLRRYGEMGVRLALGETKGHVYRSMLQESLAIGLTGSVLGTLVGLGFAWLMQTKGINVGSMMEDAALMMPSTFHAQITPATYYIGFIPGVLSTLLGTALSGIGIYKRKTAQLFKELEK